MTLTKVEFPELPGWGDADLTPGLSAFHTACAKPATLPGAAKACADLAALPPTDGSGAHFFLEKHFTPYRVSDAAGGDQGLFTGYYEPELHGSHSRHDRYQTPLYGKPCDLVTVDLGVFKPELKGSRITGRLENGALVPYYDRREIDSGAVARTAPVLAWVDDPVEAFFLQVQGSGRVVFEDGTIARLGYNGVNGHEYVAIGKTLIAQGELKQGEVTAPAIKAWLVAHPDRAQAIMESDPSYVFFAINTGAGPVGSSGRVLSPGASLAIDRKSIPLGSLLWLDADGIMPRQPRQPRLDRLMLADDTGGAIKGAVRGDIFFGTGAEAAEDAGMIKSRGRYWLLVPNP